MDKLHCLMKEKMSKSIPFAKMVKHSPGVINVHFNITDHCVCKCNMCDHWKWPNKKTLSFDTIKYSLEGLNTVETVVLTGGEPILHPEFLDIAKYFNEKNIHIGLLTSGQNKRLTKNDWLWIFRHTYWTRFSIDGFTPELYKEIRGAELKPLLSILELSAMTNKTNRVNFTVQEKNVNDIVNAVSVCEQIGIDIAFCLEREFKNHLYANDRGRLNEIVEQIRKLSEEASINVFGYEVDNEDKTEYLCMIPLVYMIVMTDGNVWPCCFLSRNTSSHEMYNKEDIDKYLMGNIFKDGNLKAISEKYKTVKYDKLFANKENYNMIECKNCYRFREVNKNYVENKDKVVFF